MGAIIRRIVATAAKYAAAAARGIAAPFNWCFTKIGGGISGLVGFFGSMKSFGGYGGGEEAKGEAKKAEGGEDYAAIPEGEPKKAEERVTAGLAAKDLKAYAQCVDHPKRNAMQAQIMERLTLRHGAYVSRLNEKELKLIKNATVDQINGHLAGIEVIKGLRPYDTLGLLMTAELTREMAKMEQAANEARAAMEAKDAGKAAPAPEAAPDAAPKPKEEPNLAPKPGQEFGRRKAPPGQEPKAEAVAEGATPDTSAPEAAASDEAKPARKRKPRGMVAAPPADGAATPAPRKTGKAKAPAPETGAAPKEAAPAEAAPPAPKAEAPAAEEKKDPGIKLSGRLNLGSLKSKAEDPVDGREVEKPKPTATVEAQPVAAAEPSKPKGEPFSQEGFDGGAPDAFTRKGRDREEAPHLRLVS